MENGGKERAIKFESTFKDSLDFKSNKFSHGLVAVLLLNGISILPVFLFGIQPVPILIFQYIAVAITGLVIGSWARCIPILMYIGVMFVTSGKTIVKLFTGKLGAYGSAEFNVILLNLLLVYLSLIIFTHIGIRIKNKSDNRKALISA